MSDSTTPEVAVRTACRSIVKEGKLDCQVTVPTEEPYIVRYVLKTPFGYHMIYILNKGGAGAATYNEKASYEVFEGFTLCSPEEGFDYEIDVEPQHERCILMR